MGMIPFDPMRFRMQRLGLPCGAAPGGKLDVD